MAISTIGTDALASAAVTSAKLASGAPSRSQLPAGTVLQVVQGVKTAWTTTTSVNFVTTGLEGTITPSSAASKVLVQINFNGIYNQSSSNNLILSLYKNGSLLATLDWDLCSGLAPYGDSSSYSYLDSPATTSATTYTLYWYSNNGSAIGFNNYAGSSSNDNRTRSTVTLMEIAA